MCQTTKLVIYLPSPQILQTFDWQISFYAQSDFTYPARVFLKFLLCFRVILCTMAPYLLLNSWKVVRASSNTAGLTNFISQRNPVLDFVLSHANGFAKWIAQPREPHSRLYEIMLIWLTQIQRHSSSSLYGGSRLPLS